jgi:hypothetical protein
MPVTYLTEEEYITKCQLLGGSHWSNFKERWAYHKAAIDLCRLAGPDSPDQVLEMGTMGVSIVRNSDTIDYTHKWKFKNFNPTFFHDARKLPWPIPQQKYHTFVALRVFHHLAPKQKECFLEAKRIARHIIIVVPETYQVPGYEESAGIPEPLFVDWNNGIGPTATVRFANCANS